MGVDDDVRHMLISIAIVVNQNVKREQILDTKCGVFGGSADYCSKHKLDSMIDILDKRCIWNTRMITTIL